MTINEFLNQKLKELNIDFSYDGEIITDNKYHVINETTLTDFGQLAPIFNWVKREIRVAVLDYDKNMMILYVHLHYWWNHTTGGGNGYTLYFDYTYLKPKEE